MKYRIYIATTEGPVEVQRISPEDPDLRSVVCLDGTAKSLPISRSYDAFVKDPTGVVQRSFGQSSFRMDVAAPITDGESWQLGAFVAHAFAHEDRLSAPGEVVENALWLTGELDRDLNVRPVAHIREKLAQSQALFEQLRRQDIRVFCFVPSGPGMVPDDDFLEALGVDGELLRLESVVDLTRIVTRFSLEDPYHFREDDEDEDDDPDAPIDLYKDQDNFAPIKDNKWIRIAAIAATVLALLGGIYMQFEDNIIALRANSLKIGLAELRAHPDHGCTEPNVMVLEQDGAKFPTSRIAGLCALQISLNNRGAPAYVWAFAQRRDDAHMLLADREDLMTTERRQGLIGWRMVLPPHLDTAIDYRIVALASSNPLTESVDRMLRARFEDPQPDWDDLKKRLIEEDVSVLSVVHSLEP